MKVVALAIFLFSAIGCVSIATHERMLQEVHDKEVDYAMGLATQAKNGDITIDDMIWLMHRKWK